MFERLIAYLDAEREIESKIHRTGYDSNTDLFGEDVYLKVAILRQEAESALNEHIDRRVKEMFDRIRWS